MPNTVLTWQTNGKKIEAECSVPMSLSDPEWRTFIDALAFFVANTGLEKLTFKRIPASNPPEYNYAMTTPNQRKWKQKILFDLPADPSMSFDVDDMFRLTEFTPQRDVRQAMCNLVVSHELQSLTVNWS